MQFSAEDEEGLAVNDELGCGAALLEMRSGGLLGSADTRLRKKLVPAILRSRPRAAGEARISSICGVSMKP